MHYNNEIYSDATSDALLPSGYGNRTEPTGDKADSDRTHDRMSPPPSYDEVVFNVEESKKYYNHLLNGSGGTTISFNIVITKTLFGVIQ